MPREPHSINPGHGPMRGVLRLAGPLILVVGIGFMAVGLIDFFSAIGGAGMPTKFWCFFVGMPLLALGGGITQFAFMGAAARYAAQEYAPVAKDTVNYMVDGTEESIKKVAGAFGEAMGGGASPGVTQVRCHKCSNLNDEDAKFCDNCGAALAKSKPCANCDELNDPDARFCDNCGGAL